MDNKSLYLTGPVLPPNSIEDKKGYYISYNEKDIPIYGNVTTAIVVGNMEQFFILTGNHYDMLCAFSSLSDCMTYFREHPTEIHPYSDKENRSVLHNEAECI